MTIGISYIKEMAVTHLLPSPITIPNLKNLKLVNNTIIKENVISLVSKSWVERYANYVLVFDNN